MNVLRGWRRVRAGSMRPLVLLALAVAAGCGGGIPDGTVDDASPEPADATARVFEAEEQACVPVLPNLATDASLSGMPGTYHLTLGTSGESPTSSEGVLTLESLPEALQEMAGSRTPLGGSTDIDVEAVGALRLGDLGSDDPQAPGVLVIESGGPRIMLRLGSEPNRRDQVAFDGGFTVLTVHRIENGGFDGSWQSGSGNVTTDGYFCARRSDA